MNHTLRAKIAAVVPAGIRRVVRKHLVHGHIDEGRIVADFFARRAQRGGTMVDVGAHYGTSLFRFAKSGFRVFAFEPDPLNRKELLRTVAALPPASVVVDPRAVSDREDENVAFFTSDVSTGISGLTSFHPSHQETARVDTVRLDKYCAEHGISQIDYLKVDTEGFDLFVLKSLDWDKHAPALVLCEFEDRKTKPLGYTFLELTEFLTERGYQVLISEWHPIVEYGRRHRFKGLTAEPRAVRDPAAWGNVIAVKARDWEALLTSARRVCPPKVTRALPAPQSGAVRN